MTTHSLGTQLDIIADAVTRGTDDILKKRYVSERRQACNSVQLTMLSLRKLGRDVESLKADLEQALGLLDEYQWAIDGECPKCRNDAYFNHGHHPDCLWANLLKKYGREVKYAD